MPSATAIGDSRNDESAEELYYSVAMMRLNGQMTQIHTIEAKASAIFTIGSTILPITASLISSERNIFDAERLAQAALVVGALSYIALVGAFAWSSRLVTWDARPELDQWKEITVGRQEEEMHRWLGDACVEAYNANQPQLKQKSRLVSAATWCLVLETLALTVAVMIPLL